MGFLTDFIDKFSGAVAFIGGAMAVFGFIQLGIAVKDGTTGSGAQIAGAIAMIAAGILVGGAGVYFGMLDTSWAN